MVASAEIVENYFNLQSIDEESLTSKPPYMGGASGAAARVFGGLAVSQAINAFTSLYPDYIPHTVNYKFISPAKVDVPFTYTVTRHDGIASVSATQDGKTMGMGHIRYAAATTDYLDSSPMLCPDYIGDPVDYPNTDELAGIFRGEESTPKLKAAVRKLEGFGKQVLEVRPVETPTFPQGAIDRTSLWLRIKPEYQERLQDKDGVNIVSFLSDFAILNVATEIYSKEKIQFGNAASLHHSLWLHDSAFDPRDFYLTVVECPVISHGRARLESYMFNSKRKCVMSIVQEGYVQRNEPGTNKL